MKSKLVAHVLFYIALRRLHSRVQYPFRGVRAARAIAMGRNVRIRKHAWFSLRPECRVTIGDNTQIGRHVIIAGVGTSITIEQDVLMSERVFIAESTHAFEDITIPIAHAGVLSKGPVRIGAGSWLGVGVCVLPNVNIGKHCVVGSNAVVTRDLPDYTVAAGAPARVIKRYDSARHAWAPIKATD